MKALYALALLAAFGIAGPAFADCASEVKMAEANVMKVTDMKAKEMAMKELEMAKKAMMDKKEAECMKAAKMANDAAMMKK
jgi:signal transduction histidine kinase